MERTPTTRGSGPLAGGDGVRWPLGYILLAIVAVEVLGFGIGWLPGHGDATKQSLFDLTMIAVPVALAAWRRAASPSTFWLRAMTITPGRAAAWIFLGTMAVGIASAVYLIGFDVHGRTWLTSEHPHGTAALVLGLGGVTLVPVAEELFWRGFVHTALRARLTMWPAIAISSTAFGFAHAVGGDDLSTVAPRIFYGVLLALLLERTGSLYPGMVAHAYINMSVLDLFVPSLATPAFAVLVVALLVAIALSVRDPRRKKHARPDGGRAEQALRATAARERERAYNDGRLGTW